MSKVIAISGWAKSGKDTSAQYLIDKGYKRVAFADILKEMVAEQYNLPLEAMHIQELKEKPLEQYPVTPKDAFSLQIAKMLFTELRTINGLRATEPFIDASGAFLGSLYTNKGGSIEQLYWTPRALCILEGSIKRSANPNYWVDRAIDKVYGYIKAGDNVVITDLRYRSEAKALEQSFGKDLTLLRINRFDSTPSADASENDLNDYKFNVTIENKSTLQDLYNNLDNL